MFSHWNRRLSDKGRIRCRKCLVLFWQHVHIWYCSNAQRDMCSLAKRWHSLPSRQRQIVLACINYIFFRFFCFFCILLTQHLSRPGVPTSATTETVESRDDHGPSHALENLSLRIFASLSMHDVIEIKEYCVEVERFSVGQNAFRAVPEPA
jgi:hypothetical protein